MPEEKKPEEKEKTVTLSIPSFSWKYVSIALGILLIASLYFNLRSTGKFVGTPLTEEQISEKIVDYLNDNLVQTGEVSFVSIEEIGGLYKVTTSYQGREIPVYTTKDGSYLFTSPPFDTSEELPEQEPEPQEPQELNISEEELTEFIGCLKDSDLKIYGANWCGWTKKLVEMLGGFDMVEPIYIECTEQKEECDEAGVTGFPTIIIGEERYQGQRTFKGFSDATGCEIPSGAEVEQSNPDPSGGC